MQNHYQTLGLISSATNEEVRRAYRILARRYHPDVNPGKHSEEKFKTIAEAYSVLSDQQKRETYDVQYEKYVRDHVNEGFRQYERAARRKSAQERYEEARKREFGKGKPETAQYAETSAKSSTKTRTPSSGVLEQATNFVKKIIPAKFGKRKGSRKRASSDSDAHVQKISIIEVSVAMRDAVRGCRKTIEIQEGETRRKISVTLPAGLRSGSVIRMRAKSSTAEEVVIIARVASHPFISIQARGLIVEVPISVEEAISGASISVPTLDDEPGIIKIPAGTQSGAEIRLREKGMQQKDGSRGDLFYRLMIKVPESADAIGIKEKASEMGRYYGSPVRQDFPRTLVDF